MPIKCDEYNRVCVMAPAGDLSGDEAAELQKLVEETIERRQIVDFVIDFEKCRFIDSKGLSTLLWAKRRCEDLFGQFKLVNLDENCRKILEITRLGQRFECHEHLEGALKTMG
ncbi:MAG: STAS domain-containing protein [Phycisphaerae bacterium]|nr:STAS domain-containing protein [Phycisphaerae bacterium]MDW8260930.1 STAS domain-containing protein [Phycisphaerales bacterium]